MIRPFDFASILEQHMLSTGADLGVVEWWSGTTPISFR